MSGISTAVYDSERKRLFMHGMRASNPFRPNLTTDRSFIFSACRLRYIVQGGEKERKVMNSKFF